MEFWNGLLDAVGRLVRRFPGFALENLGAIIASDTLEKNHGNLKRLKLSVTSINERTFVSE